ncbi:hypothetical protein NPIL_151311 [Nephila pilipes]|uniref:Uncharacterized protein n=1 Tax=Nephila pilipes TaxID=299642 RepID=A0A8X6MU53_NEPPI|nr:hypothetical protein NPIL_151311 [Nephila pilipes]
MKENYYPVHHQHQMQKNFKPARPLTDEDLAELKKSAEEEETEDQEDPSQEEEDEGLTLERLAELMRTAKTLQEKAKSWDPYKVC